MFLIAKNLDRGWFDAAGSRLGEGGGGGLSGSAHLGFETLHMSLRDRGPANTFFAGSFSEATVASSLAVVESLPPRAPSVNTSAATSPSTAIASQLPARSSLTFCRLAGKF